MCRPIIWCHTCPLKRENDHRRQPIYHSYIYFFLYFLILFLEPASCFWDVRNVGTIRINSIPMNPLNLWTCYQTPSDFGSNENVGFQFSITFRRVKYFGVTKKIVNHCFLQSSYWGRVWCAGVERSLVILFNGIPTLFIHLYYIYMIC